jgi:hypothetical protein
MFQSPEVSNVETAKKLGEKSKAGNLLDFYKFELSSKLNFGKHQICRDAETECNARLEQLSTLQVETQIARECTAVELRNQLKACSAHFLDFGKQEWVKQCSKTSQFNILDQHFVLKGQDIETPMRTSDDEYDDDGDDVAVELKDTPRSKPDHIPKFQLFTISTYLYAAATNNSKTLVDIRKRQSQITEAKEKAAKLKALQREVDLRADVIKPSDAVMTQGRRFVAINARLDDLQASTAQTANVGDDDDDVEERLATLEERLRALESSDPVAKLHPSKNEKTGRYCRNTAIGHCPQKSSEETTSRGSNIGSVKHKTGSYDPKNDDAWLATNEARYAEQCKRPRESEQEIGCWTA